MTLNDLYVAAVKDLQAGGFGVARVALSNGDELICSVARVAGRSITRGHYRTNYLIRPAGEEFSKPYSRAKAKLALA